MADTVFDLDVVTCAYNDINALNGLSMSVEQGQRIALIGANGSGKSTLLRLLDALYFAPGGTINVFGKPLTETHFQHVDNVIAYRRRVGFVFQNPDVPLFNPTVFDEVAFGPLQLGWEKNEIRRRVAEMLDFMTLGHLKDRAPYRLSGGEKKRVALACVLIGDPEVLLLDEPTTGLDPESQSQVINLLVDWGGGEKPLLPQPMIWTSLRISPMTVMYCRPARLLRAANRPIFFTTRRCWAVPV